MRTRAISLYKVETIMDFVIGVDALLAVMDFVLLMEEDFGLASPLFLGKAMCNYRARGSARRCDP